MKHPALIFGLFITYIVIMTAIMIWQGIGIAPDRYAFVLLLGSLLIKRTRSFLLDWIPFLFLLISYDFLRGIADNISGNVHIMELINLEKSIFGTLPTITLQQHLLHSNSLAWYDYLATIFYFLHFALPLAFGYLLWLYNKSHFRQFVTAISLLSYGAWATYLLFPAAPPWYANNSGYISGVTKILDLTLASFPTSIELPTIYHQMNPNQVAAIPSLHAAYPFLVFIFALRLFKKKALFFLPYVLWVWFAIVYLGEHYVVDAIIGAIYALVFYLLSIKIMHAVNWSIVSKKIKDHYLARLPLLR